MKMKYPIKQPDMSRNPALAGKTVYANGMNVTYDESGYAVKAVNPNHPNYKGTTMGVRAQPIEDALAGKEWSPDYAGLVDWNNGSPDDARRLGEQKGEDDG